MDFSNQYDEDSCLFLILESSQETEEQDEANND